MPIDELLAYFDSWTGTRDEPSSNLQFDDHGAFGSYHGLRLYSVFQAVFSSATRQPVAHEALLRARRILPKLIEIFHDLGAQVVVEGIETAAQHDLALAAGADLVQGYCYARPSTEIVSRPVASLALAARRRTGAGWSGGLGGWPLLPES